MSSSTEAGCDLQDWMSRLSPNLCDVPLCELAIPGSHNSFSYSLDPNSEIGPDVSDGIRAFASMGKGIFNNWNVCQSLTFKEQLASGIRYFDLRVAWRRHTNAFHFLHGLIGMTVELGIKDIVEYLTDHAKEVVILDFNHFYDMDEARHGELMGKLVEWCGDRLCMYLGMESLNLDMCWENGLQIVVLYHQKMADDFAYVWPGHVAIRAPWAKTSQLNKLVPFLESTHAQSRGERFHVVQGVLTPDTGYIFSNLMGCLKNQIAKPTMPKLLEWVKTKARGTKGINIVIADFVELDDFARCVISLNEKGNV